MVSLGSRQPPDESPGSLASVLVHHPHRKLTRAPVAAAAENGAEEERHDDGKKEDPEHAHPVAGKLLQVLAGQRHDRSHSSLSFLPVSPRKTLSRSGRSTLT